MKHKTGSNICSQIFVNKLIKIKKNILPHLISNQNREQPSSQEIHFPNKTQSYTSVICPQNILPEPKFIDQLIEENISLKNQVSKLQNDIQLSKKEISSFENDLAKKDKIIEELLCKTRGNLFGPFNVQVCENPQEKFIMNLINKVTETQYILNIKKKYKDMIKDHRKTLDELECLKKSLKRTKFNEITIENQMLTDEIVKIKNLYSSTEAQNRHECMLNALKDNIIRLEAEIKIKDGEIKHLTHINDTLHSSLLLVQKKFQFQFFISQKHCTAAQKSKEELDDLKHIQKTLKSGYEKDREIANLALIIKEKENIIDTMEKQMKSSDQFSITSAANEVHIAPHGRFQEENKRKKEIEYLKTKLRLQFEITQRLITQDYTNQVIISQFSEPEYFSDFQFQEFVYILIKNLEANEIDVKKLESRIFNHDALNILLNNTKVSFQKDFISKISKSFCEILQVKNPRDQRDIISFVQTFFYNNYLCTGEKDPEEFMSQFLSIFSSITNYSNGQKEILSKLLSRKLNKSKQKMFSTMNFFNEKRSGYITFTMLKKIIEQVKLNMKHDLLEYFIFVMKSGTEAGLRELKYINLNQVISEDEHVDDLLESDDESSEENKGESYKYQLKKEEELDQTLQVTYDEYISTFNETISTLAQCLVASGRSLDDFFILDLIPDLEYRGLELYKLVEVLRNEFKLDISNLEAFCLLMKLKPGLCEDLEEDSVEEIIDYDKLVNEVDSYIKHK